VRFQKAPTRIRCAGWTEELNGVTQDGGMVLHLDHENPEPEIPAKSHDLDEDADRTIRQGGSVAPPAISPCGQVSHAGGIDHYQGSSMHLQP
jgi:hypothetical protein